MEWLMQLSFSFLATVGFGIIINIPRKGLIPCGLVGTLGWAVYLLVKDYGHSMVLANLLAAFVIGISAMFCARMMKMPMILFNIPSLVPLVPGGQSYNAVRSFAFGMNDQALDYLVQAGMIAGAIAVGFFLAEFVSQVYFKVISAKK